MNQLIQIYHSIPPDALALLLGVIGASALQQKIKNWLELENPKVLVLLTTTFSLAAAVVPAALGYLGANPGALGTHTAMFFTGMTLAYRYVIQPGSVRLESFKADRAKYQAFKARQQAASDGVVVGTSTNQSYSVTAGTTTLTPSVTTPTLQSDSNQFDG